MTRLTFKPASASRSSSQWQDEDYDVLVDGIVVDRIMKVHAAPVGTPWLWTLTFGQHEDANARLRADARGRDGGIRQELARAKQTTLESKPERGRRSVEAGARRAAPHPRRGPRS
jgi:hypothetical protein